jgi:hypothetical protein
MDILLNVPKPEHNRHSVAEKGKKIWGLAKKEGEEIGLIKGKIEGGSQTIFTPV